MEIKIFAAGGTIDKIDFDAKSEYQVGEPTVIEILKASNVTIDFDCESLIRKDSLDMTDEDRRMILETIANDFHENIVVTHGTDTMVETARELQKSVSDKTIVFTGSMAPAKFNGSDATFNVACAVTAAQTLPPGVYIAMNGQIFNPETTRKNVPENRFESIGSK